MAGTLIEKGLDFELTLNFKNQKEPDIAFSELGEIFQTLYNYDKWLLSHISSDAVFSYSLEGLEYSSIRTRIAQILRGIPDDAIKSLDLKQLIGSYLLKAKYLILKKLEQNKTIDSKAILESLTTELNSELGEINKLTNNVVFNQVNIYVLLNNIEDFTKIANKLRVDESIEYKSKYGTARVGRGIFLNKTKIITELGATTVANETTEILKIKKIDMLSDEAKWNFKLGNRDIPAKILDKSWLDKYHKREIILQPFDCLKVKLKSSYTYTNNNEHTQFHYEIIKVLDVITPDTDPSRTPELF